MFNFLLSVYFNSKIKKIYNSNLEKRGFSPNGVFWNSTQSQHSRFEVLLYLLKNNLLKKTVRIADVGCGCGDFLSFLRKNNFKDFSYQGYDINVELIKYCKRKYPSNFFMVNNFPIYECDFSIMSGTYNYTVTDNFIKWEEYIIYNLMQCYKRSKLGMIFNLQFSKNRCIRNNIYYTHIGTMESLLEKNFEKVKKFFFLGTKNDIYFIILRK